jgi:hypothetical protein
MSYRPAPPPVSTPGATATRRALLLGGTAAAGRRAAGAAAQAALDPPAGPVLLRIGGAIAHTNDGDAAAFDDAMLGALPQVEFTTRTLWTRTPNRYGGPSLRAVLAAVGAGGGRIHATAANAYRVEIDRRLIGGGMPIVARRIDGAPFGVRARGPLWMMFPFDDRPDLRTETVYAQCIWHLTDLTVDPA